jgi:hypothetical protein
MFDHLVNTHTKIQTNINTTDVERNEDGRRVNGQISERQAYIGSDGKPHLTAATITLFEKNIIEQAKESGIGTDDQLAATTGHELGHATDENLKLRLDKSSNVENEPERIADDIILEYLMQKHQNTRPVLSRDDDDDLNDMDYWWDVERHLIRNYFQSLMNR